jgi:hypothetical protein
LQTPAKGALVKHSGFCPFRQNTGSAAPQAFLLVVVDVTVAVVLVDVVVDVAEPVVVVKVATVAVVVVVVARASTWLATFVAIDSKLTALLSSEHPCFKYDLPSVARNRDRRLETVVESEAGGSPIA